MKKSTLCRRLVWTLCASIAVSSACASDAPGRPNILLVIADDLGYTDIGAFGGEINTPALDALASEGLQLTGFHTAPTCSPTRAMLYSGTDPHLAGLGNMAELIADNQRGRPGYEGYLNENVMWVGEVLRDLGYRTSIVGKWHLGLTEETSPAARGFDDSWVLLDGGASHFEDGVGVISSKPKAQYRADGKNIDVPEGFFSSAFYTDKAIEKMGAALEQEKPFFTVLSYTAPHWPLQAPDDYIDRYQGHYDRGYKALFDSRITKMKALGLLPTDLDVSRASDVLPEWSSLSDEARRSEARKMEIYAAMVDNMDFHLGRVIDWLKQQDQYENTVIIFMSDNGAEGKNPSKVAGEEWLATAFDNSYDNLGRRGSYIWYGEHWAHIGAAPGRLFKGFTTEGGITTPAIIRYPGKRAGRSGEFVTAADIAPTLIEIAGGQIPTNQYNGRPIAALSGASLFPWLTQTRDHVHGDDYSFAWELFGQRALRAGDWKILSLNPPEGDGQWALYNLAEDPMELNDLAGVERDRLLSMTNLWRAYVSRNNVVLPQGKSVY